MQRKPTSVLFTKNAADSHLPLDVWNNNLLPELFPLEIDQQVRLKMISRFFSMQPVLNTPEILNKRVFLTERVYKRACAGIQKYLNSSVGGNTGVDRAKYYELILSPYTEGLTLDMPLALRIIVIHTIFKLEEGVQLKTALANSIQGELVNSKINNNPTPDMLCAALLTHLQDECGLNPYQVQQISQTFLDFKNTSKEVKDYLKHERRARGTLSDIYGYVYHAKEVAIKINAMFADILQKYSPNFAPKKPLPLR